MRKVVLSSPLLLAVLCCSSSDGGGTEDATNGVSVLPPVMSPAPIAGAGNSPGPTRPPVSQTPGSATMPSSGAMTPGAMTPSGPTAPPPPPTTPPATPPPPASPMGAAGSMAMPAQPPAMPAPAGNMDPVIPAIKGECPQFRTGTITFMGLGGIDMQAGAKAAGPTAPMVFYWHGTGSFSGEYAVMAAAVHQGVISEGGVLISFQDTTGGDFSSGTAIFGAGDWNLTDQLLACAVKDHNIDPRRVFATGCSAGGLFSTAMAAQRSTYIAAAAPNSGGASFPPMFQNKHVPALMTIHGAPGVDVVGLDFSQSSATADMAFKAAGGFVVNCNHGGGHCGGGGLAPDIWTFFKAHPFGVSPEPWTALPPGFNSACKIF